VPSSYVALLQQIASKEKYYDKAAEDDCLCQGRKIEEIFIGEIQDRGKKENYADTVKNVLKFKRGLGHSILRVNAYKCLLKMAARRERLQTLNIYRTVCWKLAYTRRKHGTRTLHEV
jgi:hypothetical protein